MKNYLITSFLSLLFFFSSFAQNRTIAGRVTDQNGTGIPGVTVTVKGSSVSTQTASDGTYQLPAPESGTLIFSSVGFTALELSTKGKTSLDASLVTSANSLNEVVVIGYGTARKKDLTGSVSTVRSKDFNKGIIISPDQLLQGKVAGLEITTNSGQPGAASTIKIRGNNSLRANNNPLYVIDGVPLDGRTARPTLNLGGNGLSFGPTPESNPLVYFNPNDIAQIDVLKDASATAIYGSRGANGVIVITTKKGTAGETKVEVNAFLGANAGFMKKYKLLSAAEFRKQTASNNLNFDSSSSVDALKAITQTSLFQNYSLAFSGGNESGKYRLSLLGAKVAGFIKKTSLDKYLGNFGGQYNFLDRRLSVDFDVIAGHTTENIGLISNTAGAGGNLMAWTLNWNPTTAFRNAKGQYNLVSNSIPNPLAVIDAYDDVADVNVVLANIAATLKITNGLDYKFLYAVNNGSGVRNTNIGGWLDGIQNISGSGFGSILNTTLTSQTFTHTLSYSGKILNDLTFNSVIGYEYWKSNYSTTATAASQFNTNLDQNNRIKVLYTSLLQNGNVQYPLIAFKDPTTEIQSMFGRVNFGFKDRYLLTATLRADGSNKFGVNNKYGYFPSIGAKWNISNENFLKNDNIINNLALRISYGITGNQEFPSGASQEQFTTGSYNNYGQSNVANPDLKWEKTTAVNMGVDYSILKGKIFGSIDYYHKNTTDLLFQSTAIQPAPASVFYVNLPANLINSGLEATLSASIVQNQKFSLDAGINIAYNHNLLTNYNKAQIPTGQINGSGVSGTLSEVIANNQPIDAFYLKKFLGYDQSGHQIIANEPTFAGDPNPHFIAGFNTTFRYKKITLIINGGGAYGYLIYNNTYNTITNIGQLKKGQNIGAIALNTGESIDDGIASSTRYLENGNYFKLRNATFNYSVGNVGRYIKNLGIFLSGTNLFVVTKFSGFDPEVNVDKNNNNYPSRNIEYIPYPTPRVITFGINFGL